MDNTNLLKSIENAEKISDDDLLIFDELFIIPQIELHDSGFHKFKIYGKRKKEEQIYILATYPDVIHFGKIHEYSWFSSIDMPYFGILRLFPRKNYRFYIPFTNISDFTIEFKEEIANEHL